MMKIESGFTELQMYGILTVIHPRKLYTITENVQKIDPEVFMTVSEVKDVRGRGFSRDR